MIGIRRLIIVAFFILLVFELVILIPETLDIIKKPSIVDSQDAENVEQDMVGVHLVEASEGVKEWELWSKKATSYKGLPEWNLKSIRVKFFGEKGVFYDVKGQHGKISMESKDMEILGDVEILSSNGYRFVTNKVKYVSSTRILEAPKKIIMWGQKDSKKGDELYVTANKMQTLLKNSIMIVQGNVRARKPFNRDETIYIRSNEAHFSGVSQRVKFIGKVVVDMNAMRVTGPRASFSYLKNSRKIDFISVSGGVKLSDSNKWATAEKINAYVSENKFVFKGSPRLVQGGDELRGQEIVFLDGGNIVKVLKANAQMDKQNIEKLGE